MNDNLSEEKRRKIMKSIKSVSKLETMITKELWKQKYRFRRNSKTLFGKPDISIKKYKIVIFIDSCFWHQCPLHGHLPRTNPEFWEKKLKRNVERDNEVTNYYVKSKWHIKRIWEHEIKEDFEKVIRNLVFFIEESKK